MKNNKIFILLSDGVGLRNFAFTQFHEIGKNEGFDIVYWNNTVFNLSEIGYKEEKIKYSKLHLFTDILKNAKIQITLNQFIRKTNDKVYDTYRFPFNNKNIKSKLKTGLTKLIINEFDSEKGLETISIRIEKLERSTIYYKECLETLKKEKPSFVFCTNQRPVIAIAPLLAAQELGIPTATFIFSWDNLPKATMIVQTDYYFVWSDFMKKELKFYYPYIKEEQILVSGTPQFEAHFDKSLLMDKKLFFNQYGLDLNKKHICFSGDDITSSPDDPQYLRDAAMAVRELNKKKYDLKLIFRRCPVDFSNRYESVLKEYSDEIVSINPLWQPIMESWNTILPSKADIQLLANLAEHCEMVINVGSSMIFDFVAHKKPCGYFRYNQSLKLNQNWDIFKCYRFVHLRSMPSSEAVIWLNNKDEIASKIENALGNSQNTIGHAENWFKIINQHPPQQASQRIWSNIKSIVK